MKPSSLQLLVRTVQLWFALLWILFPNRADAWSSVASKTCQKTKCAAMAVEEYRRNSGKLPDAQNCWASIRKDTQSIFAEQPDAFLDFWKRELVYRAPGSHGKFDVYSVGADGIDDQGEKDDISSWNGVNEGYYWKKFWPLGRFTIIASCVFGSVIFCVRGRIPRYLGKPLSGLVITGGMALGSFLLLHPGVVPSRNGPLSLVIVASGFLSIMFLMRAWSYLRIFKI